MIGGRYLEEASCCRAFRKRLLVPRDPAHDGIAITGAPLLARLTATGRERELTVARLASSGIVGHPVTGRHRWLDLYGAM